MCLRIAKKIFSKYFSLKARLTIVFTLLIFVFATGVTLLSYGTMVHLFNKAEHEFVSYEINTIKYYLTTENISAINQEIRDVPGIAKSSTYQYYVRVYDSSDKTLLETQEMAEILPLIEPHDRPYWPDKETNKFQTKNGRSYLLMESYVKANDKNWLIQIILDISYQNNLVKAYQKYLVFALLFAALLSTILGYIIMKRGMRSLHDITKAAHNITSSSLHKRIDPSEWPKELSDLGLAFNQMLARIEESFLRLKQFSADLAHELRTPISNLMGETEVALLLSPSIKDYRQVLESNLEDLKSVTSMVENLLFLAHTDNPKINIKKNKFEIKKEITKLSNYYETLADEKQIKIFIEGEATLIASPEMFNRMLSNLLSNALKYTTRDGKVFFKISEEKQSVIIEIQDSGIGIAEKHLKHVFDRFYRVDKDRSKHSGGIGLGLAIVKSIVDLHQGTICIQSQINVGTRVILVFPK